MASENDALSIFSNEDSAATGQGINEDLDENYFSKCTELLSLTSSKEIEFSIEKCKESILAIEEMTDEKRLLVERLIQLRLRLQEVHDFEIYGVRDCKLVLGHQFEIQRITSIRLKPSKLYCEICCGIVWVFVQSWFCCSGCGSIGHGRCLNFVKRTCPSVKAAENPGYIMKICPEQSLLAQGYTCTECRTPISYAKNAEHEPHLCDYSGMYFCSKCHWGNSSVIPARVIFNWDFERRPVSRYHKQYLRLISCKAVLNIEQLNPQLFSYVDELAGIKRLRKDIMIMKQYLLTCKQAMEQKLLLLLCERQHFVEGPDMYSMKDLIDVQSGVLVAYLEPIHSRFASHIIEDCEVCCGKGHVCRICNKLPTVFAFQTCAVSCSNCNAVFHRECLAKKRDSPCPKCDTKIG